MNAPVMMLCCSTDEKVLVPSVKEKCFKCGGGVWVTYASLEIAARRGAKYVCFKCVQDLKEIKLEPIAPGQMDEVKKIFEK